MRLWQNAQSKFASEEGFRLTLWQAAQASSRLKCVSHMRLWRMHKHVFVRRVFQTCTCGKLHKQVRV